MRPFTQMQPSHPSPSHGFAFGSSGQPTFRSHASCVPIIGLKAARSAGPSLQEPRHPNAWLWRSKWACLRAKLWVSCRPLPTRKELSMETAAGDCCRCLALGVYGDTSLASIPCARIRYRAERRASGSSLLAACSRSHAIMAPWHSCASAIMVRMRNTDNSRTSVLECFIGASLFSGAMSTDDRLFPLCIDGYTPTIKQLVPTSSHTMTCAHAGGKKGGGGAAI
jgi:hypothetical protein